MEIFAWYVFGGAVLLYPVLLFAKAKYSGLLTLEDILMIAVLSVLPFIRELSLLIFFDVQNVVVWKKNNSGIAQR